MTELPAPLTASDAELRNFHDMPLDVQRLLKSDLVHDESPEACWSALLLWCVAWHEVPAGSLPDNDEWLAKRAGYWHKGKLDPRWLEIRDGALHGWMKCSDGRLYHPVLAEKVNVAWAAKHRHAYEKLGERIRKRNKARAAVAQTPLELPDLDQWIDMGRPTERSLFPSEFSSPSGGNNEFSGGKSATSGGTHPASSGIPPEASYPSAGIPPEKGLIRSDQIGSEVNTYGTNTDGGTPRARDSAEPLVAAGISTCLRTWERDRGKAIRNCTPSQQQVIELAELQPTPTELRRAYELAVEARDNASDPNAVNAGFVRSKLEQLRAERHAPPARASPSRNYHDERRDVIDQLTGRKPAHEIRPKPDDGVVDVDA